MASVRVVKTAFGDGLVAARDIAAGETVLTEQPGFLLVDGAPVTRPRLLAAVSGALGLAPDAEKSEVDSRWNTDDLVMDQQRP